MSGERRSTRRKSAGNKGKAGAEEAGPPAANPAADRPPRLRRAASTGSTASTSRRRGSVRGSGAQASWARLLPDAVGAAENGQDAQGAVDELLKLDWASKLLSLVEVSSRQGKVIATGVAGCLKAEDMAEPPGDGVDPSEWAGLVELLRTKLEACSAGMKPKQPLPGFKARDARKAMACIMYCAGALQGFWLRQQAFVGAAAPTTVDWADWVEDQWAQTEAFDEVVFPAALMEKITKEGAPGAAAPGTADGNGACTVASCLREIFSQEGARLPLARPGPFDLENAMFASGFLRGAALVKKAGTGEPKTNCKAAEESQDMEVEEEGPDERTELAKPKQRGKPSQDRASTEDEPAAKNGKDDGKDDADANDDADAAAADDDDAKDDDAKDDADDDDDADADDVADKEGSGRGKRKKKKAAKKNKSAKKKKNKSDDDEVSSLSQEDEEDEAKEGPAPKRKRLNKDAAAGADASSSSSAPPASVPPKLSAAEIARRQGSLFKTPPPPAPAQSKPQPKSSAGARASSAVGPRAPSVRHLPIEEQVAILLGDCLAKDPEELAASKTMSGWGFLRFFPFAQDIHPRDANGQRVLLPEPPMIPEDSGYRAKSLRWWGVKPCTLSRLDENSSSGGESPAPAAREEGAQ